MRLGCFTSCKSIISLIAVLHMPSSTWRRGTSHSLKPRQNLGHYYVSASRDSTTTFATIEIWACEANQTLQIYESLVSEDAKFAPEWQDKQELSAVVEDTRHCILLSPCLSWTSWWPRSSWPWSLWWQDRRFHMCPLPPYQWLCTNQTHISARHLPPMHKTKDFNMHPYWIMQEPSKFPIWCLSLSTSYNTMLNFKHELYWTLLSPAKRQQHIWYPVSSPHLLTLAPQTWAMQYVRDSIFFTI